MSHVTHINQQPVCVAPRDIPETRNDHVSGKTGGWYVSAQGEWVECLALRTVCHLHDNVSVYEVNQPKVVKTVIFIPLVTTSKAMAFTGQGHGQGEYGCRSCDQKSYNQFLTNMYRSTRCGAMWFMNHSCRHSRRPYPGALTRGGRSWPPGALEEWLVLRVPWSSVSLWTLTEL